MLDLGIDLNAWPWVWLFVAVVFLIIEVTILGGSFILLPFGVSAFIAAILGFYEVAIELQWAVFVLGGAAMWVGFYRWARRFLATNTLPPGVGADRLVGMLGTITVPVDPTDPDRRGRVSVDGEMWGVISDAEVPLRAGTRVRITSVQGTRVVVESVAKASPDSGEEPT